MRTKQTKEKLNEEQLVSEAVYLYENTQKKGQQVKCGYKKMMMKVKKRLSGSKKAGF